MTRTSLTPQAAAHEGIEMPTLCDWMLQDGWNRAEKADVINRVG